MFDFSRITDLISDLAGGSAVADTLRSGGLTGDLGGMLQNAGIDPSALAGLDQGQIMDLLAERGIDTSVISEAQFAELLSGLGFEGDFASQTMDFLGGESDGERS